jgi:hypothetical protein
MKPKARMPLAKLRALPNLQERAIIEAREHVTSPSELATLSPAVIAAVTLRLLSCDEVSQGLRDAMGPEDASVLGMLFLSFMERHAAALLLNRAEADLIRNTKDLEGGPTVQ